MPKRVTCCFSRSRAGVPRDHWSFAALSGADMDPLPPALRQGVDEFNRAHFFEAHETLEDLWRETSGPLRLFYQGLIQLAVGLYHLSNGNRRGALNLLGKGLDKLSTYQPVCQDIDVDALCRDTRPWLDRVRQAGEAEFSVDPEQLPRIRWVASERGAV